MRLWLFHPLVFFPLVLLLGAFVVGASIKPQLLPRPPAQATATISGNVLTLRGRDFNAPVDPAEQHVTVVRDFWGRAQSLKIAALPGVGPPRPDERGVEILFPPEATEALAGRRLRVEVSYRPLPINASPVLAVAALGSDPVRWVRRPTPPLSGIAQYDFVAPRDLQGIGLRALHADPNLAFGVEIVSIRISAR